jgi:hypothetical protein
MRAAITPAQAAIVAKGALIFNAWRQVLTGADADLVEGYVRAYRRDGYDAKVDPYDWPRIEAAVAAMSRARTAAAFGCGSRAA